MEGVRKLYAGLSVCLCSQTGVCDAANCLARVAETLASDKLSGGVGAALDGARAIAADRQMSQRNDAFASRAAGIYGRSVHVPHESSCAQLTATRLPLSDDTDMLQWPSLSCSMLSLRAPRWQSLRTRPIIAVARIRQQDLRFSITTFGGGVSAASPKSVKVCVRRGKP